MIRIRRFLRILPCLAALALAGCPKPAGGGGDPNPDPGMNYRAEMRTFVEELADYAHGIDPAFILVAQNGPELLTTDGTPDGDLDTGYASALDGLGQEHPFYGQDQYNVATPRADRETYLAFLDRAESEGIEVMVTDYCNTSVLVLDAYGSASARNYIAFAAPNPAYDLDTIPAFPPAPFGTNSDTITSLAGARNFLYLIDSTPFGSRAAFVTAVQNTNYDLLVMDPFHDGEAFTGAQVTALKQKVSGGSRLVLAYVNIGAAENWRYYWQNGWGTGNPSWIDDVYEGYPDEHWVEYWDAAWKTIIYGNADSYLKRVLDAGFDGVYLDNILAFEHFEAKT